MPTGPGPRQRRATKIANRSHVTPFDKLAQWNAQIMNLGTQGAVPSIVGNSLEFVKLTAADIPGVMDNPATEDLDMNGFGIIRANRLEVDSSVSPYISITGINDATLTVKSTNTALIEMEGPVNTIIRGKSKLKLETDNDANSNNIEISPYGTLALQSKGVGGAGSGTIVIGDSTLALMDLTGNQISLDAGTTGLQMGSDGGVTIDATTNIEIDAAGRLDLSGNQIFIDSDGAGGVNVSSATDITMDAANVDIEATTKLDLSGNNITINSTNNNIEVKAGATLDLSSDNSKLNGTTTLDITGANINIGTSSSIVDISGQITLNNVSNLTATDITATGTIQGGSLTDGVATLNAGALSGTTTITSTGQIQGGSLTDGTAIMSSGSMTGLIDVSTNSVTLINTKFTSTSQTRDISNAPYVWGVNYLEQIDPTDIYLLGNYKQIRSALFIWSGTESISFAPPNNVPSGSPTGIPVVNPPCQGGGELLELGTPQIWDLPTANYQATNHTFTIPALACRTMMTVELSADIFYPNVNNAPLPDPPNYIDRVNVIRFWLGKNAGGTPAVEGGETGPMAYRLATLSPAYFGTNASEPTYSHYASTTLMGGESLIGPPGTPQFEFKPNDTFYLTAQQSGTAGLFPQLKKFRVKVTWEALY